MKYSQYRFKFYLNASHAIYIDGMIGEKHPHTWEIEINAIKQSGDFIKFEEVEMSIETFLEKYQNQLLNNIEPFTTINPTLENLTEFILNESTTILAALGWIIFTIEVSETPTRSYIISLVENNIVRDLQVNNLAKDIIDSSFAIGIDVTDNDEPESIPQNKDENGENIAKKIYKKLKNLRKNK